MNEEERAALQTAIPTANPSRILPVPKLSTILSVVLIGFCIYAFFSGITLSFYASFVFWFYSFTHTMWVSVVLLGVFQTLLLIPFRIINLIKSAHIKEFSHKFKELKAKHEQEYLLKQSVRQGERVALFYVVNFVVQLVSYTSIGRLFLIDFYSKKLDPTLLYDFVPYPDYPITGRFFKIPYVWFNDTVDLGMRWVWIAWAVILALQIGIYLIRYFSRRTVTQPDPSLVPDWMRRVGKYSTGYLFFFPGIGLVGGAPFSHSLGNRNF